MRIPLLGHSVDLARDPLGFTRSLRDRGEVTTIFIGPRPVLVVTSVDLIRAVLVTEARKFDKGAMFDELRTHLGNGLVTSAGSFHRRQRRLAQPAFHGDRISGYADVMTARTVDSLASWSPGKPVELTEHLNRLTLDVLLDVLFGSDRNAMLDKSITAWLSIRQKATKRALSPVAAWVDRLRLRRESGRPAAGQDEKAVLCATLAELIERRRAGGDDDDLLSMLLSANNDDGSERMSNAEVCDELLTMFVAGTGTMSATLAWTWHELSRHPEIEKHLHREVDTVLMGRAATISDLPELSYTRRVAQEVLRLHPVWLLMRRALEPVAIGEIRLDPGDDVYFSPHALHRDPALYPAPERFDPDRWLPERSGDLPRFAYIPFGAGNRLCIGEGWAWTELVIVIATIAARWRLVPEPGFRPKTRVGTVERPHRLPMIPEARGLPRD